MKKNVWIAITKSRPLPGCDIDMDGCEFYFADVFVPFDVDTGATALISVIDQVRSALTEAKFELADIILCAKFSSDEWVDQTDSLESMHELANKALGSTRVVLSGFRSEEIQGDYQYRYSINQM